MKLTPGEGKGENIPFYLPTQIKTSDLRTFQIVRKGYAPAPEKSHVVIPINCFLNIKIFQVVKSGALPRVPDCFQRTPKRVGLQHQPGDEILAMTVDGQGIHAIIKNVSTNKMNHRVSKLMVKTEGDLYLTCPVFKWSKVIYRYSRFLVSRIWIRTLQ